MNTPCIILAKQINHQYECIGTISEKIDTTIKPSDLAAKIHASYKKYVTLGW
jgi:hypothetical protein